MRTQTIIIALLATALRLTAADVADIIPEFTRSWPNLRELSVGSPGYPLLIDESCIADKSALDGSKVRLLDGEAYSSWFMKFNVDESEQVCAVYWDARLKEFSLLFADRARGNMDYGIAGSAICVPGDGFVYSIGRIPRIRSDVFYVTRYVFNGERFREQPQAIIHLDVRTKVNADFKIYSDESKRVSIGTVQKGSTVTIVGIRYKKTMDIDNYTALILTPLGLCGWMDDVMINKQGDYRIHVLDILSYQDIPSG